MDTFSFMFHANAPYAIGYVTLNERRPASSNATSRPLKYGQKVKLHFQSGPKPLVRAGVRANKASLGIYDVTADGLRGRCVGRGAVFLGVF